MINKEGFHFGYVPLVCVWNIYKNSDKSITFYELCLGDFQVAHYYLHSQKNFGKPMYQVRGLAKNVKDDLGMYTTKEEAEKVCLNVAKYMVSKLKGNQKILTFTN